MPWRTNGDYYSFKEDAIKFHAPPVCGVYGVFNYRHHVLIGRADNLREALLRHVRDTNFRYRRFQPTGFTFEACPLEASEMRHQDLVWEYDPILTNARETIGFAALWRSLTTPGSRAFYPHQQEQFDRGGDSTTRVEQSPAARRQNRFVINRERIGLVAAVCGVMVLGFGLLGLFQHFKASPASLAEPLAALAKYFSSPPKPNTQVASLAPPAEAAAPQETTQEKATPANREDPSAPATPTLAQPRETASPIKANPQPAPVSQTKQSEAKKIAQGQPLVIRPQEPKSAPASKANGEITWSVQVLATPEKTTALVWVEKLKTKGFEPYIVEVAIKGQPWFRVRIGNFASRQEADALRATLSAKEGLRDAFVADSLKANTRVALR